MEIKKQIFPEQPGQPAAVKTHFGWALMGPKVRNHASRVQNLNHSVHASPGIMQVQVSQTEGPRLCPVLQKETRSLNPTDAESRALLGQDSLFQSSRDDELDGLFLLQEKLSEPDGHPLSKITSFVQD